MRTWLKKIIERFKDETGVYPTESDLLELEEGVYSFRFTAEMTNSSVPLVDHLGALIRLHKGLDLVGVPDRGRGAEIAKAIGYSKQRVAKLLRGEYSMSARFVAAVCNLYGIDKEWVSQGNAQPHIITEPLARGAESGKASFPTIRPLHPRDGTTIESHHVIDAPTLEVINDMKKLSESDRWAFVGRVKPIIRELIENSSKSED